MELKCTPLKELADKSLRIKERLVCSMIDFSEDYKHPFKESHVYIKCACMLILMYLHQAEVPVQHLKFLYSVLWQTPEKDLLIMEQDYDKIVAKIRCGKAHELSEGDTTYLGACRKGQKNDSDQFYTLPSGKRCDIPAPKRAFSFKPQYMRTILEFIQNYGENAGVNTAAFVAGYDHGLISKEELQKQSFENINYSDILQEDDWYESRLYELFTSRFLYIVFRDCGTKGNPDFRLQKAFFWTMPYEDLLSAEPYWKNIKDNVAANRIDSEYFYRESEHKKFHVRPKAKNASDLAVNPNGGYCKKYCCWFNHEYIQHIAEDES